MKVFITGIGGFIGSALASRLLQSNHQVMGSVSSTEKLACKPCQLSQCFVIRMNEDFDPSVFSGVDHVVHCAYDLRKGRGQANFEGTEKLAKAAIAQGVKWQTYIGSYSAHDKATSEYGLTKLRLEKLFEELGQIVVKPGLVIGNGGIFLKMSSLVRKTPFVPLIDGGKGTMPVVAISDLVTALLRIIEDPKPGRFRLYNPEPASLREILTSVKRVHNVRTIFVPVPAHLVYLALVTAAKLRLPLQVDVGNLKGFQANQSVNEPTDLFEFVSSPASLTEMVRASRSD